MKAHLVQHDANVTDQSEKASPEQVENSAGGFVFEVTPFTRLQRFLILGSEGGTYYATERKHTLDNIKCVEECLREDGKRVVSLLVQVSLAGRAPKQSPTLFALAAAFAHPDLEVRQDASEALPQICRTSTMLFEFLNYVQKRRGWGRLLRNAVASWYEEMETDKLALQLIKYRQREGWTHRDVIRKAHPVPVLEGGTKAALYEWVSGNALHVNEMVNGRLSRRAGSVPTDAMQILNHEESEAANLIVGFDMLQGCTNDEAGKAANLVIIYGLPRECVPTELLTSPLVWEALLHAGDYGMPITALVRNLGNMTKNGLLEQIGDNTNFVCERLTDREAISRSRIHPFSILTAMLVYKSGHGQKGKGEWQPIAKIVDALDEAFYLAFENVEPTGKRMMLALDVSASMGWTVNTLLGIEGLTARVAAAAMAMVTARAEDNYIVTGFTADGLHGGYPGSRYRGSQCGIKPLNITGKSRLGDALREVDSQVQGGTDCALPMIWAMQTNTKIDTFVIYTDNETWAGSVHPHQALAAYRKQMGAPDAKLVVVGMTATDFSIADPNDVGMMDIVGMDSATPQFISEFSAGKL